MDLFSGRMLKSFIAQDKGIDSEKNGASALWGTQHFTPVFSVITASPAESSQAKAELLYSARFQEIAEV